MTVYQAVKQFSPLVNDQSETDTDTETPIGIFYKLIFPITEISFKIKILISGNASVWVQQHTIYYRPIEDDQGHLSNKASSSSSSRKSGKSSSSKLIRKKTEFWTEGTIPQTTSPLTPFLCTALPSDIVTVQDASLDALCMLRIINALNRHWESLYGCVRHEHIIQQSEFIHSKVSDNDNILP